jgi:dephospho-CoA kinase
LIFQLASTNKHILKIGVTGGIGSGKTVVCDIFARFGVPVLHSDEVAKELTQSNTAIRKKLITFLGTEAYLSDGTLNRQFVASKIFSVIHPQVEKERERRIKELMKQGHRLFIVEAALIYEAELDKKLDAVVVVDAEESTRIARVRKRDAVPEENVRARIHAQLDVNTKLEKADYVIHNNDTLEDLESKVRFLYTLFNTLIIEG